jgi:amidase
LLCPGDCHAARGDEELSGAAITRRPTVTLQVDIIKGWSFSWPGLATENLVMTIGPRPLEVVAHGLSRTGSLDERRLWLRRNRNLHALGPAGRIRRIDMVDPDYRRVR